MKPSADHIRRHLLGLLPPDERDHVESFLMTDTNASDAFDIAEQELAEAFVRGELDPEEAQAFQALLRTNQEMKGRVELIRHLIARGQTAAKNERPSSRGFALAATLLAGMGLGGFLLLGVRPPDAASPSPEPVAAQVLRLTDGITRTGNNGAPSSLPVLVAGRAATIEIPIHEGDRFERYRVTLRQGETTRLEATLARPTDLILRIDVAARMLSPGNLRAILEGFTSDGWMAIETFEAGIAETSAPATR